MLPVFFLFTRYYWVRRVVETIWNVGAGDPGSLPVQNANSGKPLKVD